MLFKKIKKLIKSKDAHFLSVDFKTYKRWGWLIRLIIKTNKNYKPCEIYRSKFKTLENFVVVGLKYNGKKVRRRTSGWAKTFITKNKNTYCIYCDVELNEDNVTADHIIPISMGGNNTQVNLVACCKDCNAERGNISFREYISKKNTKLSKVKYIKI